eukprot:scaffold3854_cov120-Skeletonema_marinoi.AAC.8
MSYGGLFETGVSSLSCMADFLRRHLSWRTLSHHLSHQIQPTPHSPHREQDGHIMAIIGLLELNDASETS